ncbi:unnamed protein product [Mytilus coruscus]|uniref:Uncharacterized protein n=1 Tax=Mytilus coruscus TaxID=42192 RepID=A0A6J8CFE2_MYTCO|nr:unnamed protein product [Mytilus coruscus]
MAQTQLNSPRSRGKKHTPSRDLMEDLDYLSDIQSQDEVELCDDGQFSDLSDIEHANEGDVYSAGKGNTYMGNSSANKDKQNANKGKQSANKGKQSANKGKVSAIKGKTRAQSDDGPSGLDCESDERTTRNWLPDKCYPVESSSSGKRKHAEVNTDSGDESEQETENFSSDSRESSDDDKPFDPSDILKKGIKVPAKITKYIEKYANQGITKNVRLEVTKNCNIPTSKSLAAKETDRYMKKLFRKKFNQPLNAKKERSIINSENRILDATGPLATLWTEAEKAKRRDHGLNEVDVIDIVQRALGLIGNAHYVYRVLPECLDLLADKDGKKALLKSSHELFGRKFRKLLTEESKDNRELFSLLPTVRRSKNKSRFGNGNLNGGGHGNGGRGNNQYFWLEPPNNQNQQFGGRGRGRGRGQSRSTPGIPRKGFNTTN